MSKVLCVGGQGFSPSGAVLVVMNGLQLFGAFCLCTCGLAEAVGELSGVGGGCAREGVCLARIKEEQRLLLS